MEYITPSNLSDILADLPDEFVEHVKSVADAAPITDDEWAVAEFITIRGSVKSAREQRESKERHRARVEAIRQHFA